MPGRQGAGFADIGCSEAELAELLTDDTLPATMDDFAPQAARKITATACAVYMRVRENIPTPT